MRSRFLAVIAAVMLALSAPPTKAQQPRAPAGGMYVNGHFYKGGQFIPSGAASYSYATAPVAPEPPPVYIPPSARRKARLAARSAARTEYRTSARSDGEGAPSTADDDERLARTRIEIAKKLIAMGKGEEARGWLKKVVEMKASQTTIDEAKKLLAGLAGPRRSPRPE